MASRLPFRRQIGLRKMNTTTAPHSAGPLELSIRRKLESLLQPVSLCVQNDSWKHRHHAAMREQDGGSGETHFSIQVVSDVFKGKTSMQRHRMIYATLSEELSEGLHALSLQTKTVDESNKVLASE